MSNSKKKKHSLSNNAVTDSKVKLVELQKLEVLTEILPEVFHKLKNILTPILGYSQILKSKIEDDIFKKKLEKIEDNAHKLANFLDILKDYYKQERCSKQKENINDIINNLEPFFAGIKDTHNIQVKLDLDSKIPDDFLGYGQIESLITNLTDNAVLAIVKKKATESILNNTPNLKGTIEILTSRENDHYKLIIRDNGIGMSEEVISKIWTPFYSNFPKRTGIGLLICKRIILNHEAEVKVYSQEGRETVFEIIFNFKSNKK